MKYAILISLVILSFSCAVSRKNVSQHIINEDIENGYYTFNVIPPGSILKFKNDPFKWKYVGKKSGWYTFQNTEGNGHSQFSVINIEKWPFITSATTDAQFNQKYFKWESKYLIANSPLNKAVVIDEGIDDKYGNYQIWKIYVDDNAPQTTHIYYSSCKNGISKILKLDSKLSVNDALAYLKHTISISQL